MYINIADHEQRIVERRKKRGPVERWFAQDLRLDNTIDHELS